MEKVIRKRMLAFAMACALLLTMFSGLSLTVHANASEIMPCYNYVLTADSTANISSSGKLIISNYCDGKQNATTKMVITTYVEKKTLGLFWTRVDIGTTDDEWVDTIYDFEYTGSHSVQLSSEGTYRITVNYVVYGTGGSADEINIEIIKEY